jgi:hypothetical protein
VRQSRREAIDPDLRRDTCQTDPDLAAVVDAWPRLPRPLRDAVLALVKSASKEIGR